MSDPKPLYYRDSKSKLRVWKCWAVGDMVHMASGLFGGKLVVSRYRAEAKNVGRANATTAEEQALKEVAAHYEHKLKRKYSETREGAEEATLDHLPMLAKPFKLKLARFPALVQRKYNGFRCQVRKVGGNVLLTSRNGMPFELPHIAAELAELPEGWTLDGEIYYHGWTLQKISSLIKRPREESKQLMFVCYDVIDDKQPLQQFDRIRILESTFENNCQAPEGCPEKAVKAQTLMVESLEGALALQQMFLTDGYEGGILRNCDGEHRYAHRSNDLLKLKVWEDADFEIVEVFDKKLPGLAIFRCYVHGAEGQPPTDDNTFEVVRKGSHAERKRDFLRKARLVGKKLRVRYAEIVKKTGKPFHPVGLDIREDFDQSEEEPS